MSQGNCMTDKPATSHAAGGSRARRRRAFIIAAVAVGFVPLILTEVGLRLAGVAADVAYQDPLVGFSRVSPLFEPDEKAGAYRTTRSRQILFERQEFPIEKPAGVFRIFCLGGSTVRGRPYTIDTSFPRWMQLELSARDLGHEYEVINCGGLSYASYRLAHILQEVLQYDPDLIVVATGHNEFLEDRTYGEIKERSAARAWIEDRLHRLRIVRVVRSWASEEAAPGGTNERTALPDRVEARLDEASGYASYHRDDQWAANVERHFDRSLRAMVDMCRSANVPVLLVLLGSNVRDCPPFKSEHRPQLSVDDERVWQNHVDEAMAAEAADPQAALVACAAAAAIDDEYALLRFRMARLLDRLGRTEEAAEHYLAAKDLDVCPLRMRESFATVLRNVAADSGAPLIDARELIEGAADNGLPGNDWYMDHVHPSVGAHQRIAAEVVKGLVRERMIADLSELTDSDRRDVYRQHLAALGPHYFAEGYERVSWLENWARRKRILEETLPRDAAGHVRYGHRLWDFSRQDEAWTHYDEALSSDPQLAARLLQRSRSLFDQGRGSESLQILDGVGERPHADFVPAIAELRREMLADHVP